MIKRNRIVLLAALIGVGIGYLSGDMLGGSAFLLAEDGDMKERVTRIKRATVRIIVNGQRRGTGFVISRGGLVATCYHVVDHTTEPDTIQVELSDGSKIPATIHSSCEGQAAAEAHAKDYCILEVPEKNLEPLPLGSFADAYEGASIYLCGFPLGSDEPIVSVGMLSTKSTYENYRNIQDNNLEVAWLDVTMNKGNSGGPILLVGKEPKDDSVIGLASFMLTPLEKRLDEIARLAERFEGRVVLSDVPLKEFVTSVRDSLEQSSIGIGGCVSIDYLSKGFQRHSSE